MSRIEWVREQLPAARRDRRRVRATRRRSQGLTIGTGIHLEPKTVALLLALRRRRRARRLHRQPQLAPSRTRSPTCAPTASRSSARPTDRRGRARRHLREVLAARPDLLLDNGGDLFVRYLERPVRRAARRHRGDDLGPDAAAAAARPARRPGPGHQRQPDQAVRRERARGRPERARVVHADHQPDDQRPAGGGVRLRRVREGRRRQLPEAPRDRRGRRDRPGRAAARRRLDGFAVPSREDALRAADMVDHRDRRAADVDHRGRPATCSRTAPSCCNAGHFPREIAVPTCGRSAGASAVRRGRRDHDVPARRRPPHPPADRRPHGQPGRPAAARQLDRVDGPRLRPAGALPGGGRERGRSAPSTRSSRSRGASTRRSRTPSSRSTAASRPSHAASAPRCRRS